MTIIFWLLIWAAGCFLNVIGKNIDISTSESKTRNCTCVPYYQCTEENGDLVTDGDLRILENSACKGQFDVLCCIVPKEIFNLTETVQPKFTGCGYQDLANSPWYAAILQQETNFYSSYKCGASLIHPRVILTAAHCFSKMGSTFSVRVGNTFAKVQKVIIHPKYNNYTLKSDIALAILHDEVKLTDKINTICIPPRESLLNNSECSATIRMKGERTSYLKMLNLKILSKEICLNKLRATRLGPFFQLHDSFLCTEEPMSRDTCEGDGGSPLICTVTGQPDRFYQAGIVSWGMECGEDSPEVYVKVSVFRDWIDKEMITLGLDNTSYRY